MSDQPDTAPHPPVPATGFASRRRFIELALVTVAAAWAGGALQHRLFPQGQEQDERPVTLALAELPVGGSRQVTYAGAPALVLRTVEGLKAFSLVCTHLGCTVEWQPGRQEFHCACHDGRFDRFGEVMAGPPPLPLEALPVAVQGDQIVVGV